MSSRGLATFSAAAALLVAGLAVPSAASAAPSEQTGTYRDARYASSTTVAVEGTLKVAEVEDLGRTPSSDTTYAVTTEDGTVLPVTVTQELPANGEFSGELVVRGELAEALADQGIRPAPGSTIDGDSATGRTAIATAEDQGTALPVAEATVVPVQETSSTVSPSAHRAYVVKMVNQGSVDGDNAAIGSRVDDMLAYWTAESDGAITSFARQGDILDYTTSAAPTASCGMTNPFPIWNEAAQLFPGVNFNSPGNHLIVLVGEECGGGGPVGVATVGSSLASGGPSMLTFDPPSFKQTGVHELGHNFGLQHANLDSCPSAGICEYFDFYSPMSASAGNSFTAPALGTLYRAELGLTTPAEVTSVTTSGPGQTQTYALAPRSATSGTRGLLVTDPSTGTTYSVDLRNAANRDGASGGTFPTIGSFYGSQYSFGAPAPTYPTGVVVERQAGSDATYLMTRVVNGRQVGSFQAGTTFSPSAGLSLTVDSIGATASVTVTLGAAPEVASAKPSISGTAAVGRTVAAQTSGWASGTTFAYDWQLDGASTGVTTQTFPVPDTAADRSLTVVVTGSRSGLSPATRTSDAVTVAKGSLASSVPTLDAVPVVDETVTAVPGAWTDGTTFTYDWQLDGTSTGVTTQSYPVPDTAAGRSLAVVVTGRRAGYSSTSVASAAVGVAAHPMTSSVPTVSGTPTVGEQLTAEPGTWTSGTAFTYLWKVDGASTGVTTRTFDVPPAAADRTVTVAVTGTRTGYATTTRTSTGVAVAAGTLTAPLPTISGTAAVGRTVTADTSGWTAGTAFTYDWRVDGVSTGTTTATYVLPDTAAGKALTVSVTGSRTGYASSTRTSAASTVALGTLTSSVPHLSSLPVVGETVTAVTGTWTPGTTFTYLWRVDGVSTGVTTSAFTVPDTAVDEALTVEVTGSRAGYATTTEVSPDEAVSPGTLAVGTPSVTGTAAVGSTVTADPGTWTPGTTFTYEWLVGGAPTGVTTSTFTIEDQLEGHTLSVVVTGTRAGYADDAATSPGRVVAPGTLAAPLPTIDGTVGAGETVTARTTGWTSGTAFTYDWKVDGVSTGVSGATYDVPASAAGRQLTVTVTGTRSGYASATRTSAGSTVGAAALASSAPTIGGTVAVGETVTAVEGDWTPGTTFSYQWAVAGTPTTVTTRTFDVPSSAAGKSLTVTVTGAKDGYTSRTRTSQASTVADGTLASSAPTIDGAVAVGRTVTAVEGDWTTGTGFAYEWRLNGLPTGVTTRTYALTSAAEGLPLTVAVTGTKDGYAARSRVSAASTVAKGTLTSAKPSISGTARVGATLTGGTGTWTADTTFTYAWVSGTATVGTARTLVVPASVVGKQLKLVVTGAKPGYDSRSEVASSATVAAGTLVAPVPKVAGTAKVGKVLTASPGSWTSGTALTYQWFAGSSAIPKATGRSIKLAKAQRGTKISVRVTGRKAGYTTVTKASATTKAVAK